MCKNLWKTVCSEISIPFYFQSFVSDIAYLFLNLLENFKTIVAYKRLVNKKACKL